METFPSVPNSEGSACETTCDLTRYQFGDGYAQLVINGLNSERRSYQVLFKNAPRADRDSIVSFLSRNKGSCFNWTPPGDVTPSAWSCGGWRETPAAGRFTINATFTEEFAA